MKTITRIGAVLLIVGAPCASFIGCTTTTTTTPGGQTQTISMLDTNAVITGINAVVPGLVSVACAKDGNAKPYFQQAVIVLRAVTSSGAVDPAMIRASLSSISIRELRNENAILAEEAGLAIYQAFASQVVGNQVDRVVWLRPVLTELGNAIQAGLPPG